MTVVTVDQIIKSRYLDGHPGAVPDRPTGEMIVR